MANLANFLLAAAAGGSGGLAQNRLRTLELLEGIRAEERGEQRQIRSEGRGLERAKELAEFGSELRTGEALAGEQRGAQQALMRAAGAAGKSLPGVTEDASTAELVAALGEFDRAARLRTEARTERRELETAEREQTAALGQITTQQQAILDRRLKEFGAQTEAMGEQAQALAQRTFMSILSSMLSANARSMDPAPFQTILEQATTATEEALKVIPGFPTAEILGAGASDSDADELTIKLLGGGGS